MTVLKQSISFRPFPGELIAFTLIAMYASDNQIVNVVGGNIRSCYTTQRKGMVNVVLFPLDFLMAIVAFALLPFVLFFDLFGGILAHNCHFASIAIALMLSVLRFVRLVIRPTILPPLFTVSHIILVHTIAVLIRMRFVIGFTCCALAYLAPGMKPIFPVFVPMKELRSRGIPLLAIRVAALLARGIVLRYSIVHERSLSLLSSRSRMFPASREQAIFGSLIISRNGLKG